MVKVVSWLHADEGSQRKGRERTTSKSQTGLANGVQTRCRVENKVQSREQTTDSSKANQCIELCLDDSRQNPSSSLSELLHSDHSKHLQLLAHLGSEDVSTDQRGISLWSCVCVSEASVHLRVI